MMGSIRGKPELTLVTDETDPRCTANMNAAFTHQAESDQSKSTVDRTMEELTLPISRGDISSNKPEELSKVRKYVA